MLMVILVRKMMLTMWERDQPAVHAGIVGVGLAFGIWPVHVLTLLCALLRVRVPHIATPKRAAGGNYLRLVIPQLVAIALLLADMLYRLSAGVDLSATVGSFFAALNIVLHARCCTRSGKAACSHDRARSHPVVHDRDFRIRVSLRI